MNEDAVEAVVSKNEQIAEEFGAQVNRHRLQPNRSSTWAGRQLVRDLRKSIRVAVYPRSQVYLFESGNDGSCP
jgi:hypothetical protein